MWIVWLDGTVTFWHCDTMKVVQCNIGTFGRGLRVVLVKAPFLTNIINCITCTVVTVWQWDILTVWHFDGVRLRQFDSVAFGLCESVTIWQCGILMMWQFDIVAVWKYDTVYLGWQKPGVEGPGPPWPVFHCQGPISLHFTTALYSALSLYCTVQCTVTILHCTVHYH